MRGTILGESVKSDVNVIAKKRGLDYLPGSARVANAVAASCMKRNSMESGIVGKIRAPTSDTL